MPARQTCAACHETIGVDDVTCSIVIRGYYSRVVQNGPICFDVVTAHVDCEDRQGRDQARYLQLIRSR